MTNIRVMNLKFHQKKGHRFWKVSYILTLVSEPLNLSAGNKIEGTGPGKDLRADYRGGWWRHRMYTTSAARCSNFHVSNYDVT